MVYWTCLYEEYRGYYASSKHATLKNALVALRKKMNIGRAESGLVLTTEPPKFDDGSFPSSTIGVMNARVSKRRVSIYMNGRKVLVPGDMYVFHEKVKGKRFEDWPTYQVMSDGSKRRM